MFFWDYLTRQIHFMPLLPTIHSLGTTRLSCQGLKVTIRWVSRGRHHWLYRSV